jgi:hypothetical protein
VKVYQRFLKKLNQRTFLLINLNGKLIIYKKKISTEAKDFVNSLLNKDIDKRLSSKDALSS